VKLHPTPSTPQTLVVSAVNLIEGGTLSVLRDCLEAAIKTLTPQWQVVALVHDAALCAVDGVTYLPFPDIKGSWLRRLWFEYWHSSRLSRELRPQLWLALHDLSPRVTAPRQVVYCHNPMPFYRVPFNEARRAPKLLLFSWFYGLFYRINIHSNHAVIVQQEWLRREFQKRYGVGRVIVARPVSAEPVAAGPGKRSGRVFIYPALPRPFKNFEVIGDALMRLERDPAWSAEVRITISGRENSYARWLLRRYGHLRSLKFIGLQSRDALGALYSQADCVLFPSRMETWGLPLSEAKAHGLAILAADLPYAHETVGDYATSTYFDPSDSTELARRMQAFHDGELSFHQQSAGEPAQPYAKDWPTLLRMLTTPP
jgi:glycosyltransferase involved in cell wall biosynthesis